MMQDLRFRPARTEAMESLFNWLVLSALPVEVRDAGPGAGRGLFAAIDIPPNTKLFTVPARFLLNCRTLAPHYSSGLNAVQLIALHLCLYRPIHTSSTSLDPLFGPYIDSLPSDFSSHPLTSRVNNPDFCDLPPSVANALGRLHARYVNDWNAARQYLQLNLQALTQKPGVRLDRSEDIIQADFLWGWLNVNTRCIYHRLKSTRSNPDNLTLCPILDFANHVATGPCMTPRPSAAEQANAPPIPKLGDPLTLLSPSTPVKAGEELFLTYGAHPNRTLYVEYGFVVPYAQDDARAEVDVQDLVEQLFEDQEQDGTIKKQILQEAGYWGDWTFDASPAVSYRAITALRLLHVPLGNSNEIQRWRDTLTGIRDVVSDTNEGAWKRTVGEICSVVIDRAKERMSAFSAEKSAVDMLWEEELHVALRVQLNII